MLIQKVFNFLFPPAIEKENKLKTFKDLDILDTVWILNFDKTLMEGIVWEINKKHIIITIQTESGKFIDVMFSGRRPLSQTKLTQNHKILFLNKPCASEILYSFQQTEDI